MASAFLRLSLGRSLSRLTLAVSARNDPIVAALARRHIHRNQALLATINLEMPSLSPTMSEGTIVKWHKKEGDTIAPGDVLCDIQTDKAVVSFDTEEEGILAKIIIPENSKDIKVGTLIALMVEEGDDWQTVSVPGPEVAPAPPAPSPAAPAPASPAPAPVPAGEPFRGTTLTMPALSPTMTEGTIIKWHKKEGDVIAPGDLLCDIQTDKAVVSMDTEEEGILAKILMPEGSADVKIGKLIALIVEEGEDWQNVTAPGEGADASAPSAAPAAAPAGEPFRGTTLTMPALSPTMTEGTIVKWHKKEGEVIAPGDVLCDIQTDKAVVSMDTEEEGILAKILVPDGTADVKIGKLIALIVEEGEDWQNVTVPVEGAPAPPPAAAAAPPPPPAPAAPIVAPAVEVVSKADIEEIHSLTGVGPSVKKLLEEYHISPNEIKPTGPHGLLKGDVLSVIKKKHLSKVDLAHAPVTAPAPAAAPRAAPTPSKPLPSPPPAAATFIDIPTTNMRKIIAKRLTESKTTIPHSYGSVACNVGNAVKLRKQLIAEGVKVSMNDFIIKAAGLALEQVPQMNATLQGDNPVQSNNVDISIAVATPNGLITPIVQNASKLGVSEISSKVKDLAGRAREGKLQLHEFQGGSFSISNLGMFGISEFTAVINPPQAAILAIGSSRLIPGFTGPVNMMTVTLSYDRRAVDEYEAAQFLEAFREIMENPNVIISGIAPPPAVPPPSAPLVNDPLPSPPSSPKLTAPISNAPEPPPSHIQNAEALAREAFIKSLMT